MNMHILFHTDIQNTDFISIHYSDNLTVCDHIHILIKKKFLKRNLKNIQVAVLKSSKFPVNICNITVIFPALVP